MINFALDAISTDKTCSKCRAKKPVTEFYRSPVNRDGLSGFCKECHNQSNRQNRLKKKNLLAYPEVPQSDKFWLLENKLKKKAHHLVAYAIRKKELVRQPCEKCGTTIEVVAHHEDYNKPLDVMWLCKLHHRERHLEIDSMVDKPKSDMVNSPPHYTHGGIETISYIKAKLTPEEYVGYLRGNIIKYSSRIGLKGESAEDAGKIEWYSKELHKFLREG